MTAHTLISIGAVPWTRDDMVATLEAFAALYATRPIHNNQGGMRATHMFATWFMLKRLRPAVIVESGLWRGQGTWLIEQACPEADIHCIDTNLNHLEYVSRRATYYDQDFSTLDWTSLPPDDTLFFFDDHQNALERLKQVKWFGFKHAIFEDNYPPPHGDLYSLKRAWAGVGFQPAKPQRKLARLRAMLLGTSSDGVVAPNTTDALYLRHNLEIYYEFPPLFIPSHTRWGTAWAQEAYPTPQPLLERVEEPYQQRFLDEALDYTWICYTKLY